MKTPILFEKVSYKIANRDSYLGDLVILPSQIYYYPHTDLIKETSAKDITESIAGEFAGEAISLTAEIISKKINDNNLYGLRKVGLWIEDISLADFQIQIENHIKNLKESLKLNIENYKLPLPFSINKADIKCVNISLLGHLKINTQYENHIFVVGITKKSPLTQSLKLAEIL